MTKTTHRRTWSPRARRSFIIRRIRARVATFLRRTLLAITALYVVGVLGYAHLVLAKQEPTASILQDTSMPDAPAGSLPASEKADPRAEVCDRSRTPHTCGGVTTTATRVVPLYDTPEKVEARIRSLAMKRGFAWPDYLVRLAKCESGLRVDAVNGKGNVPATSVDRGAFQINDYWQRQVSDACAFDLDCAANWAMDKIEAGGQGIWVCDRLI